MEEQNSEQFFLERYGLSTNQLDSVLGTMLGRAIDDADLYFEYLNIEGAKLKNRKIEQTSMSTSQGVGARVIAGEQVGYGHTDEIALEELREAGKFARMIAESSQEKSALAHRTETPVPHDLYSLAKHPITVPLGEKTELLRRVDALCRAVDPRIIEVTAEIEVQDKRVLIVSKNGWMVGDSRPLIRLMVRCTAKEGSRIETGGYAGGGRIEFSRMLEDDWYVRAAKEAARIAIVNLSAIDAPAGMFPVVLGPGWPGILLHEAVGHGLEGDFNRKGTSAFAGRLGQKVASELVTVIDDGTIANRRGSLNVDDEGTPTQRTVLIERGMLVGYLQDTLNARLMGMKPTGNGRRENFHYAPMPRMTNTFMLAGEDHPEDIIRSTDHGIYLVNFGGGQVDITTGKFVFSATEAYLIEGGRVTSPIKGATLIGNGPEALKRVSMVGNNLELDEGTGTCGKDGQNVPVGVGLPTIKIDEMTVGGTSVAKGGKN